MPLIELARFPNRIAAEIARGRLAVDGIDSVLFEEGLAALGLEPLSAIRLMVDDADERAGRASLGPGAPDA